MDIFQQIKLIALSAAEKRILIESGKYLEYFKNDSSFPIRVMAKRRLKGLVPAEIIAKQKAETRQKEIQQLKELATSPKLPVRTRAREILRKLDNM